MFFQTGYPTFTLITTFHSVVSSVLEFKVLYSHSLIISFLLCWLSMSAVLYYYHHFMERKLQGSPQHGKERGVGNLDPCPCSGCSSHWPCPPPIPHDVTHSSMKSTSLDLKNDSRRGYLEENSQILKSYTCVQLYLYTH